MGVEHDFPATEKVTVLTLGALLDRVRVGHENIAEVVLSALVGALLSERESLSRDQLSSALLIGSILSRIKAASLIREREIPEGMEEALDVREEVQLLGLIHRQMFASASQWLSQNQGPAPFLSTIKACAIQGNIAAVGTSSDLIRALAEVLARAADQELPEPPAFWEAPPVDVRAVGRLFVSNVSSGEYRSFAELTKGLSVPAVIVCFLILLEGLAVGAFDFDSSMGLSVCLGSSGHVETLSSIVESL